MENTNSLRFIKYVQFLVLILFLFSCQSTTVKSPNKIRIAVTGDPQTLDPRLARDLYSIHHVHLLYEGLFRKGVDGETIPALASTYKIYNAGKSYRFLMNDSSRWSNGEPITAYDVERSWKSVFDPQLAAPFAYQFSTILKIEALNDRELLVELEHPDVTFIELLTTNSFFPVHSSLECFSGPFILKEWDPQHRISFTKNPYYRDQARIEIEEIEFEKLHEVTALRLYEKGTVDWIGSPLGNIPLDALSFLKEKPLVSESASTRFLRVNVDKVPIELRKALSSSIDRQQIIDLVTKGNEKIAYGFLPSIFGMEEKAIEAHKATVKNPLVLIYIQHESNHRICQLLEQQWIKQLGVRVVLKPCNPKVFYQRLEEKDYDLAIGTWYAGTFDPLTFLEVLKHKNETGWENPRYYALLESATEETDLQKRRELLVDAQSILREEMPIIPLFYPTFIHLKKKQFDGIQITPLGFMDFHDAKIQH